MIHFHTLMWGTDILRGHLGVKACCFTSQQTAKAVLLEFSMSAFLQKAPVDSQNFPLGLPQWEAMIADC